MITVIDNTSSPLYECFSVSEAAGQMVVECNNVINDLMMGILLTEHAYLYESGSEISYTDKYGALTEAGFDIGEKVSAAIDKCKEFISEVWYKLSTWVEDKIGEIKNFFAKRSIKKEDYDKAAAYYSKNAASIGNADAEDKLYNMAPFVFAYGTASSALTKLSNTDGFWSRIVDGDDLYSAGGFYASEYENVKDSNMGTQTLKNGLTAAGNIIFEKNEVIKNINKAKNEMNKKLEDLKKVYKAAKGDDYADVVKQINAVIKSNANVARDKIKIYQQYVAGAITLAKYIISNNKRDEAERKAKQAEYDQLFDAQKPGAKSESFSRMMGRYFAE